MLTVSRHGQTLHFDVTGFSAMPYVYRPLVEGKLYEEAFLEYVRSLGKVGQYVDVGSHLGMHSLWFTLAIPASTSTICLTSTSPLRVADGQYDTGLLTDVLEHIRRPTRLFGVMARLLAPAGKLLLTAPFFYWIHEAPHDYAPHTAFMLRSFNEESGLRVDKLEATGGSLEILLDMLGKHLSWSSTLAKAQGTLARWALAMLGFSAASRYTSRWFLQGCVLVAQKVRD
jgi:hypothetical protein